MKAIRIHERTGISGLVYEEAPNPTPIICEVLAKVAACGIMHNELNYPIWICRAGERSGQRCGRNGSRWDARPGSPRSRWMIG